MTPQVKDLMIEALTLVCTEHFTFALQTVLKDKSYQFISRLNDCKEILISPCHTLLNARHDSEQDMFRVSLVLHS